jgi:serine protease Do
MMMEMTVVGELERSIQSAAAGVGPAVVGLGRGWGVGSGVVFEPGHVLTNAHNLRRGDGELDVSFGDGRREPGRVAGVDVDLDVGVIAVETGDVTPVRWEPGAGSEPVVGQLVFALGNPGGRGLRVTPGFVSAIERSFRGPRGRRINGAIEHTAPLPRGSSGGALIDASGALLGLNTIRVEGGLILALPADAALREAVSLLAAGEAPERARLGVAILPARAARRLRRAVGLPARPGLLVQRVEDGSPAAQAGVQQGDLLVEAGSVALDDADALYQALDQAGVGGSLELTIVRGEQERIVSVGL